MTRHYTKGFTTAFACAAGLFAGTQAANAADISIFCSSAGVELELCQTAAETWAKETGNTVTINRMPANWGEALPIYQQLLASKSPDIDLMTLDNIWIGALAPHLMDLRQYIPQEVIDAHFASALADATTADGQLLAMPWFVDAGLMFYRKDLLEKYDLPAPATWQELTETARTIQTAERETGNKDMWGYVWQARAYEGLTCDGLELIASFGGGNFIAPDGSVTIDNPKAVAAMELAASWINDISPEGVLNYDEEGSRGVFEAGNSVFHRNWSYVWGTSQEDGNPMQGKVGVMALPVGAEGERSSGCYGAGMLGVSKYSEHPEEAASLAAYLTNAAEQRRRAMQAYSPTIEALYSDPEVLEANPVLEWAAKAYEEAASRPSIVTGTSYNRASQRVFNALHSILNGSVSASDGLAQAQSELERIAARGWK